MVSIDVGNRVWSEERLVYQVSAVRCNCKVFPAQEIVMLGVFLDHDYILDSDPKFSVFIVSRFI